MISGVVFSARAGAEVSSKPLFNRGEFVATYSVVEVQDTWGNPSTTVSVCGAHKDQPLDETDQALANERCDVLVLAYQAGDELALIQLPRSDDPASGQNRFYSAFIRNPFSWEGTRCNGLFDAQESSGNLFNSDFCRFKRKGKGTQSDSVNTIEYGDLTSPDSDGSGTVKIFNRKWDGGNLVKAPPEDMTVTEFLSLFGSGEITRSYKLVRVK